MIFHNPLILLLIPLAALMLLFAQRRQRAAGFTFSSGALLEGMRPTLRVRLRRYLVFLRLIAATLVIVALGRPQSPVLDSKIETEGIDIVLAIDSSTSMLAEDFTIAGKRLSRIDIVKKVVEEFIKGRNNDRIAIITFAARAYNVCPPTLDYSWLLQNLERITSGMVEDGTAIGSGIASSLNRLRNSKAKSKVVILLTDGRNNTGDVAPLTAAEAAKALKVKIYTIGAGSRGLVPYPAQDIFGNKVYQQVQIDLDEGTLKKIADITDAKYFRATDTESLKNIYREIDKLQKSPLEDKGYQEFNELFSVFLIAGLLVLFAEIILANTFLRKVP